MLDEKIFSKFVSKVDTAHQQFCVWLYLNNEFAKHQDNWNQSFSVLISSDVEKTSRGTGSKYKNFFDVVIPSLQHSWILALSRLFDPAYNKHDKKKEKPRLSLEYIFKLLDDVRLVQTLDNKIKKHQLIIQSLKTQRNNFIAHNDISHETKRIEAGVEDLLKELDNVIESIKQNKKHLANAQSINLKYIEVLSRSGVREVFDALLKE